VNEGGPILSVAWHL